MTSRTKNILFYSVIAAYIVSIGFLREFLFINLNYQLARVHYKDDFNYRLPASLEWLESFSYSQLYYGKWLLTGAFCLLFFIPTFLVIRKIFNETKYLRWTILTHLCIAALSVFFYLCAMAFNDYDRWYGFSRTMAGFLQSPWILIVLLPAFKIAGDKNPTR